MIYFTIKEDAKNNTHAMKILREIHAYAKKHEDYVFPPGEITKNVLSHVESCILQDSNLPDSVSCYEIKMLAKIYLKGERAA